MGFLETGYKALCGRFVLLKGMDIMLKLFQLQVRLGDGFLLILDRVIKFLEFVIEASQSCSFLLELTVRLSMFGLLNSNQLQVP